MSNVFSAVRLEIANALYEIKKETNDLAQNKWSNIYEKAINSLKEVTAYLSGYSNCKEIHAILSMQLETKDVKTKYVVFDRIRTPAGATVHDIAGAPILANSPPADASKAKNRQIGLGKMNIVYCLRSGEALKKIFSNLTTINFKWAIIGNVFSHVLQEKIPMEYFVAQPYEINLRSILLFPQNFLVSSIQTIAHQIIYATTFLTTQTMQSGYNIVPVVLAAWSVPDFLTPNENNCQADVSKFTKPIKILGEQLYDGVGSNELDSLGDLHLKFTQTNKQLNHGFLKLGAAAITFGLINYKKMTTS